jgi:hypothetical protein
MNDGTEWNSADWEMASADLELEQMGFEALDRCLEKGADPEDLKTVAWIAGLQWTPKQYMEKR